MQDKPKKSKLIYIKLLLPIAAVAGILLYFSGGANIQDPELNEKETAALSRTIVAGWKVLSGDRPGKVIFARPPKMFCLDLKTGIGKEVPGIVVAGAAGRKFRGRSPRPFWAPDGKRFVYRFNNRVYVCDESGRKRAIINRLMDCSAETRWSWYRDGGTDWLAGPSTNKNVILVNVSDPTLIKIAYGGGNVEKHCEITGTGKYVVYDDGSRMRIARFGSSANGMVISQGRSCRPCAAADDRVAWLPAPHNRYRIFQATSGRCLGDLKAPPGEEIYRLNWSNQADFAVHMYGANNNLRMHVRKVSNGDHLFIGCGCGWDPDLWIADEPTVSTQSRL